MKKHLFLIGFLGFLTSCSLEPKEINYGHDACSYCKMTIVDKPFASEIINSKGKAFLYDAVECMVKNDNSTNLDAAKYYVNDFQNPIKFIDAITSFYVISDKIKSPMGANLAAFQQKENAEKFIKENGGNLYNWDEIKKHFQLNEK